MAAKKQQYQDDTAERIYIGVEHPLVVEYGCYLLIESYYIINKETNSTDVVLQYGVIAEEINTKLTSLEEYFGTAVNIIVAPDTKQSLPRQTGIYIEDLKKKPEDQKKRFARERGTNRFGLKYYKQEYIDNPYIVGPPNELAYSVCLDICNATDSRTAFLYGPPGTGKSHLIEYLAYIQSKKGLNIYFNNGTGLLDDITQYFTDSRKYTANPANNVRATFVHDFRNMDIFILDDIQAFDTERKLDSYLAIFFTLYEIATHHKCKMIFTSDKPVSEFMFLESRIVSRLSEAQSAIITLPDERMKIEYINKFAEKNAMRFERGAIEYLLRSATFRVLKGLLQTCLTYKDMNKEGLINGFLRETFESKMANIAQDGKNTVSRIRAVLGEYYGIDPNRRKENTSQKGEKQGSRKPRDLARIDNITYYVLQGKISNSTLRNMLNIKSAHHKAALERGEELYKIDKQNLQNKIKAVIDI